MTSYCLSEEIQMPRAGFQGHLSSYSHLSWLNTYTVPPTLQISSNLIHTGKKYDHSQFVDESQRG